MKLLDVMISILNKLCGVFLIIMTFITFAQAFYRYVLGGSFLWAEELTILGMIWICFLGSIVAMRSGGHTRIDFLINLLPAPAKRIIETVDYLLMAVFCGYLGYVSIDIVKVNKATLTTGLGIPRAVMYSALTAGMILMVITLLIMAFFKAVGHEMKGGEK